MMAGINGVPFPKRVKDLESFNEWTNTIDREQFGSEQALVDGAISCECAGAAHFIPADEDSRMYAKQSVYSNVALQLFYGLINAPKHSIYWRVPIEERDYVALPPCCDRSLVETRRQAELRVFGSADRIPSRPVSLDSLAPPSTGGVVWRVDYLTDSLIPVAYHSSDMMIFKAYTRCSLVAP